LSVKVGTERLTIKPGVVGYVFGEIGQEDGNVEADVLGRTVEAISKLVEVDFAVLVCVDAHHDVINLLTKQSDILINLLFNVFLENK